MTKDVSFGVGSTHTFYGEKYHCIASRSTKERAEVLKKRLTRIGTIKIRIKKMTPVGVGLPTSYWIFARPDKQLTWENLDRAIERLM